MLCELTTTQKDRSGHDAILREDSRHDPGVGGRQQGEVQQGRRFDAGMNPGGEKADWGRDAACNLFHVHKESSYRLAACTFFPPLCKGRSGGVEPTVHGACGFAVLIIASTSPHPSLQRRGISSRRSD